MSRWPMADMRQVATATRPTSPEFEYAAGFSRGLAPVKIGGRCGYIDKTGGSCIVLHEFGAEIPPWRAAWHRCVRAGTRQSRRAVLTRAY